MVVLLQAILLMLYCRDRKKTKCTCQQVNAPIATNQPNRLDSRSCEML